MKLRRPVLGLLAVVGVASATFTIGFGGCCWECSSTCEETCDVKANYCLVVWGRDPDGSNVYAHCTPFPASCNSMGNSMIDCACLLADLGAEASESACAGNANNGFRVDDCRESWGGNCQDPDASSSSTTGP